LWFHLYTTFLFTKSDFKTIIVPQSVFAVSAAMAELKSTATARNIACRLPHMLAWLWLHLLVECIANQRQAGSVVEDAINKLWRPIPSGRISPAEAQSLLRVAVPITIFISAAVTGNSTVVPSLGLNVLTWLYNDLDGANAGPISRNLLNALGIAFFGWGATAAVLGPLADSHVVDVQVPLRWLALTAAITMTTVQCQDLADLEGDRARDRSTMPLRYGERYTCWSVAIFVIFWSIICPMYWQLTMSIIWFLPLSIGLVIAILLTQYWNRTRDKVIFRLWCVWVTVIYLLPLFKETTFM
jgi:4-hydroxybenzoate polyprenyltransferase